jgi:hypothetical protein
VGVEAEHSGQDMSNEICPRLNGVNQVYQILYSFSSYYSTAGDIIVQIYRLKMAVRAQQK